jgi:hypothetical protein
MKHLRLPEPRIDINVSDKVKVTVGGHNGTEKEQGCDSILSLTSAVDEGGWSTPRPSRLISGKEPRCPLYRKLVGPQAGMGGC